MSGRIDHHDDAEKHGLGYDAVELSRKPGADSVAIDIEPQSPLSSMRKSSRKSEITVKVNIATKETKIVMKRIYTIICFHLLQFYRPSRGAGGRHEWMMAVAFLKHFNKTGDTNHNP